MTKALGAGLAILIISFAFPTSSSLAAKKGEKSTAPAAATASSGPAASPMFGQVSEADRALYMKNQRDSGMQK